MASSLFKTEIEKIKLPPIQNEQKLENDLKVLKDATLKQFKEDVEHIESKTTEESYKKLQDLIEQLLKNKKEANRLLIDQEEIRKTKEENQKKSTQLEEEKKELVKKEKDLQESHEK